MEQKKGISYYKDWIYIILFTLTIISFVGKAALLSDQVKRNTNQIEEAHLKVLVYKMEQIEIKIDKLTTIILAQ